MPALARIRSRAGDESGFVLIAAILVMAALLILVVAITAAATHVNHATTRTAQSNQALAAANAGIQAAMFELNSAGSTAATQSSVNVGNGASYSTSVSSLSSASSPCTGLWVSNSSQAVNQDCVTSVGTQNGVSVRVQARVVGFPPNTSLFPLNGIFSQFGFRAANNVAGTFDLGANGEIEFDNSVSLKGHVYYPSGANGLSQTNNACNTANGCTPTMNASPIALPGLAASTYATVMTTNNNNLASWPSQSITYNSALNAQTLSIANTNNLQTIQLNFPAGNYYYCEVNLQGANSVIINATSAPVNIYIDNTNDNGHCAGAGSPTGQMLGANSFSITDSSPGGPKASDVNLFFYGDPNCNSSSTCPQELSPNNNAITADVYAPYSSATTGGTVTWTGALVIGYMTANGALNFTAQAPSAGGGSGNQNTIFYPASQSTCVGTSISSTTC
jgi:hypothetical protein